MCLERGRGGGGNCGDEVKDKKNIGMAKKGAHVIEIGQHGGLRAAAVVAQVAKAAA
jgi:UDP-galactopyranose mutase